MKTVAYIVTIPDLPNNPPKLEFAEEFSKSPPIGKSFRALVGRSPELQELVEAAREWGYLDSRYMPANEKRLRKAINAFESHLQTPSNSKTHQESNGEWQHCPQCMNNEVVNPLTQQCENCLNEEALIEQKASGDMHEESQLASMATPFVNRLLANFSIRSHADRALSAAIRENRVEIESLLAKYDDPSLIHSEFSHANVCKSYAYDAIIWSLMSESDHFRKVLGATISEVHHQQREPSNV